MSERIEKLTAQNTELKKTIKQLRQENRNLRAELKAAYGQKAEKKYNKGQKAETIRRNDKKVIAEEIKIAAEAAMEEAV